MPWPLYPWEAILTPTAEEAVWAPKLDWTSWKREKSLAPTRM